MVYAADHLQERPGRLQVVVEWFYSLTRGLATDNMSRKLEKKYFPFIATLFVFILVTNLIGYIPLPVNSIDKFTLFGAHLPSFQLYAVDTNVAFPLDPRAQRVRAVQLRGDQVPRARRLLQEPDPRGDR